MNAEQKMTQVVAPEVKGFFDQATYTITYVVRDPSSQHCAIIDPVLDYDPKSGRTSTKSADEVIEYIAANKLEVDWILETHAHADHISGARYLKEKYSCPIAIGAAITTVQETFKKVFNLDDFTPDGSQFDNLFNDGDEIPIGNISGQVIHTPGHTPACLTYVIGDAVFVGDTLFMPDYGTARVDFPGGDAATLYQSIHKIFSLPEDYRLFMCHDYLPAGRAEYAWETTVKEEKAKNIHVGGDTNEADFVAMRTKRDKGLEMPVLILPSIQINIRAGEKPDPESNGISYLKIPLDML
mgnify:CR=1 FL=1